MIVNEALESCGYRVGLLRGNELIKGSESTESCGSSAASGSTQPASITQPAAGTGEHRNSSWLQFGGKQGPNLPCPLSLYVKFPELWGKVLIWHKDFFCASKCVEKKSSGGVAGFPNFRKAVDCHLAWFDAS